MGGDARVTYWHTRWVFQRALAFVYAVAFLIVIRQYVPLVGEEGILPIRLFLKRIDFWDAPSLFWWNHSDALLMQMGWAGLLLSLAAFTGFSDRFGPWVSALVWGFLWLAYLSFVNVGQVFYGYGWESILLETGFLAIFFGSSNTESPKVVLWLLRWVLFRVMFGAGLIKIRGDECWRDLTCLMVHYETQPLPNPLSWSFHWLPPLFHKAEVLFTHIVELLVPWGYFLMQPWAAWAGGLTLAFQFLLILSGNLSWLNHMTVVLTISCLDDRFFARWILLKAPQTPPPSGGRRALLIFLTVAILGLSILPTLNMLSPYQLMNASFNPLHLVNTYGAFGSVTKVRREVILEGTEEDTIGPDTVWKEYGFPCKPGDVSRAPCIVSPYHHRIDWQMWFAAMSTYRDHPWILNLAAKLLENDPAVTRLLARNPFPEGPPKYVRAELYEYHFTTPGEKAATGKWWKRRRVTGYLPPLSLEDGPFVEILRSQRWLD